LLRPEKAHVTLQAEPGEAGDCFDERLPVTNIRGVPVDNGNGRVVSQGVEQGFIGHRAASGDFTARCLYSDPFLALSPPTSSKDQTVSGISHSPMATPHFRLRNMSRSGSVSLDGSASAATRSSFGGHLILLQAIFRLALRIVRPAGKLIASGLSLFRFAPEQGHE